ncbi:MAG: alpha-L-arabinofuranosidase [Bacteroidaceae bacterium]|nr:alpha-L-arabinofuranosidase [Bacteroidaceae bacterium]
MKQITTLLCLAALSTLYASAQQVERTLSIDVNNLGIEISPTLSGIFFEDINQSLDGGICAQMIQNNSFQAYKVPDGPANEFSQSDTVFFGWTVVRTPGAVGEAHAVSDHPLVKNLERKYDFDPNDKYDDELRYVQYCVRFDISAPGKGFGIAANGFGIAPSTRDRGAIYSNNTQRPSLAVESGVKYNVGLYLQGDSYKGKVSVWLEDINGAINSNIITIKKVTDNWKQYTGSLKALRSTDSRLVITGDKAGTFYLDFVTMLPEASHLWMDGKAGPLRKDMMEALAQLHPKFMRFPGGCASEGPNYFGQVFWKNSVGRPEERIGFRNHWGYWTSQYVGFYEYFLMAESLGASPLPVLNNGVTCQFVGHSYIAPLETEADRKRFHDIFVQDALDLIEFCNGPVSSKWGKLRAEMGHPAPFNLKYLGIGNENQGSEFWERFDIMYKAVKAQYPDIIIVSTAGARDAGREFDANYAEIDSKYPDTYVDEHYYKGDDWFFSQGDRYAPGAKRGSEGLTYDRNRPTRVFVGEFANNGTNNAYHSTLAEAAYWLSLERNSDMVVMAAYAPLFCKKGYNKWGANLIWFDNRGLWRTTNYYYQKLFSEGGNRALRTEAVMDGDQPDPKIYTSTTIDTKTGTIYLKFVNAEAVSKKVKINITGGKQYNAKMEYITSHDTNIRNQGDANYYSSHPDVGSDFNYHEAIVPQSQSIGRISGSQVFEMPENSVGIIKFRL